MEWYSLLEQNTHVISCQISTQIHQKNLLIKQVGLLNLFQKGRPSLGHEETSVEGSRLQRNGLSEWSMFSYDSKGVSTRLWWAFEDCQESSPQAYQNHLLSKQS